jgi:hypothetical protein
MAGQPGGRIAKWSAGVLSAAVAVYGACIATAWYRYGRPAAGTADEADPLLDQFMPVYEVAERHHTAVDAPAEVTLTAACEQDLAAHPLTRTIFKARELVLGAEPDTTALPHGLIAFTKSLGWSVLAEIPERQIIMGAVTQPWLANVVFRGLPPEDFRRFSEPDYVKIVWTLRADPVSRHQSIFRTETRALATDAGARSKFRWYWARFSPGIILIRWLSLGPVRREAERRWRSSQQTPAGPNSPSPVR